jgi:hypothetical protein
MRCWIVRRELAAESQCQTLLVGSHKDPAAILEDRNREGEGEREGEREGEGEGEGDGEGEGQGQQGARAPAAPPIRSSPCRALVPAERQQMPAMLAWSII